MYIFTMLAIPDTKILFQSQNMLAPTRMAIKNRQVFDMSLTCCQHTQLRQVNGEGEKCMCCCTCTCTKFVHVHAHFTLPPQWECCGVFPTPLDIGISNNGNALFKLSDKSKRQECKHRESGHLAVWLSDDTTKCGLSEEDIVARKRQWATEDDSTGDSCGQSRWRAVQQERTADKDNTSGKSGHQTAQQEWVE